MRTKTYANGYYYETCELRGKPLKYCPNGTCCSNTTPDGSIQLQSYRTIVIDIDCDGWIECTGTYSRTTATHISAFLKEYAPKFTYHDMKSIYLSGHKVNLYTGELKPLMEF